MIIKSNASNNIDLYRNFLKYTLDMIENGDKNYMNNDFEAAFKDYSEAQQKLLEVTPYLQERIIEARSRILKSE